MFVHLLHQKNLEIINLVAAVFTTEDHTDLMGVHVDLDRLLLQHVLPERDVRRRLLLPRLGPPDQAAVDRKLGQRLDDPQRAHRGQQQRQHRHVSTVRSGLEAVAPEIESEIEIEIVSGSP